MNAQHSASTNKWGTPADIVERARNVMGIIDLDPCSSIFFDQVVQAERYYSLDDHGEDGLVLPWWGSVYLNPPGKLVKQFWRKAMSEPIDQMIYCGFSVEQLSLLADEPVHPLDMSFCILRKRIKFTRHDGYSGSPSHSNFVCGYKVDHDKFIEHFAPLGRIYGTSGLTGRLTYTR